MLEVQSNQKSRKEFFHSYDDLFNHLTRHENLTMAANPNPNFTTMNWRFTLYAADRVNLFFGHLKDKSAPIKLACDQKLSLIEICAGNFTNPEYVAQTTGLNLSELKKKWALDYCRYHNMIVTEKV